MTNTMVGGTQTITAGNLRNTGVRTLPAGNVRSTGVRTLPAARTRSRRASRNMILTMVALMAAVFVLVGLSAYAASIQHANNVLTQENAYLQAEIDSLNSQIVEQTKVTRVEEVATKEYGMVYPTSDNCIVINENEESSTSLAASIRSEAYN
ncbi:MAG: cell division protein FtsL [Mogibacterium sp.]|nr:cell division protein FtsL [Mogibacterium sp.]